MSRVYSLGLLAAIAVAWLGAVIHASGRAPIGLVSIGMGLILGLAIHKIAVRELLPAASRVVIAAVLLSLVMVLMQHAWLYREYRRQWHDARENSPHVMLFRSEKFKADRPLPPGPYLAREASPHRIALWCADAALIMSSAAATVWIMQRRAKVDTDSQPQPPAPGP